MSEISLTGKKKPVVNKGGVDTLDDDELALLEGTEEVDDGATKDDAADGEDEDEDIAVLMAKSKGANKKSKAMGSSSSKATSTATKGKGASSSRAKK